MTATEPLGSPLPQGSQATAVRRRVLTSPRLPSREVCDGR